MRGQAERIAIVRTGNRGNFPKSYLVLKNLAAKDANNPAVEAPPPCPPPGHFLVSQRRSEACYRIVTTRSVPTSLVSLLRG